MAKRKSTRKSASRKTVATITHDEATRKNIPTAEYQSVVPDEQRSPIRLAYERRNRDLDPQLVWRGKDQQDWSDLVVHAPPLYIQEKVHPKVLIDDLVKQTTTLQTQNTKQQLDLFADFNGLPDHDARTEFYQHDAHWSNRMILGDSLQVMASLAEREGLRGKVQCIYLDPPYGIKFNSNFQWSTTSRDVKDGKLDHITREPEQVKAFRDTWRDGIHSYLTYLRDRLTVARDLLTDSGSIFVQIGDENVHRVRAVMDEVFGEDNFIALITLTKTTSSTNVYLAGVADYVLFYGRDAERTKYRTLWRSKEAGGEGSDHYNMVVDRQGHRRSASVEERAGILDEATRLFTADQLQSASMGREKGYGAASWFEVKAEGRTFLPTKQTRWKTNEEGMARLKMAGRFVPQKNALRYMRKIDDFAAYALSNVWTDLGGATDKRYVVETAPQLVQRCLLMTTDLVLDPTCGSGTTAYVAEQWGRRWITIDTSRVALALARARIMGARYPYYLLADSPEGLYKEAELSATDPSITPTNGDIRHGFVYERVPHITLKSIANNAEIDVIWEKWEQQLAPLRERLTEVVGQDFQDGQDEKKAKKGNKQRDHTQQDNPVNPGHPVQKTIEEWQIPREKPENWPPAAEPLLAEFWKARIARQKEIDVSIAAKADYEYLYDKPYADRSKVRVAGPFTVESISPHRVLTVDENDELIDPLETVAKETGGEEGFVQAILGNLKTAGVQQAHKEDKIEFTSLAPWPGKYLCAEGRFQQGNEGFGQDLQDGQDGRSQEKNPVNPVHPVEKRAGIFIGPEFGTVSRQDLVLASREAADAGFDVVVACAFSYDAHSGEFKQLGRVRVLQARINADMHMADNLKNTGQGNLFVIFGEPDIDIEEVGDDQIQVKINGVDVFHPNTGKIESDNTDGIACWFIDTDYNEESFFVRHAYFLGASDPYKSLKTTLKSEINPEAWESLHSDTSRPFDKPKGGRIAVKVINHLGDEVMKVFRI